VWRDEQPDRAVAPLLDVGLENEARIRFDPISSVIDRSRFENTSIRTGSAIVRVVMPLPILR